MSLEVYKKYREDFDSTVRSSEIYIKKENELLQARNEKEKLKESLIISEHNEADANEK